MLCAKILLAALATAFGFTVNVLDAIAPLKSTIYDSFGSSHASTTLRATWRDHFKQIQRDVPFQRVRFHGILDDDLSTYLNGEANGALVFDTLDFLVAQGIHPTLELGFMPDALAFNSSLTTFHYKGGTSMYRDEAAFRAFITGLLTLIVQRYGIAEVLQMRVEIWNEPNCGFGPTWVQQQGCGPDQGNQTAYFQLYQASAEAVKAVDARIPVGGPATAQLAWLPEFLNFTSAAGVPLDFVSSHLYPTDPFLPQTRDSFMDAVAAAAGVAGAAGKPLFLTEFNAGLGPPRLCHNFSLLDSSYAAVFALHAHLLAQGVPALASMSWWTFTDFGFEEQGADPHPYWPGHTKFGAMTRTGVPKPIYRGLQLIAAQAGAPGGALPVAPQGGASATQLYRDAHGAVIGASEGAVDVLVSLSGRTLTALAGNFNASFLDLPPPATVSLVVRGLTAPLPTQGTLELLDSTHANPMGAWEAAGSPLYPSASETAGEMAASQLVPEPLALTPSGPDAVTLTFTLESYAMARVVIAL